MVNCTCFSFPLHS